MVLQWRAAGPGDRYAVNLWEGEVMLPYSVCRVTYRHEETYEAWRREPNGRGGFFGGEIIGFFHGAGGAAKAKAFCVQSHKALDTG